ncbi:Tetraketide alpha-pyrone reductase 1 [Dichanthelium oligosanthes]|uniref:Tetraketide alpha-pyrone reductase 1 n=1 Tax=Dichanthelium oligosanthes TaxID=888268 RepID=A0A1E5W3V9_9POAL|nr:Tetraketide alpha-pyrone reductase 1 [Dichanthelium oligosanthes]
MAQPPPETLSLAGRRVAFTTPQTGAGGYGGRLGALLRQRGAHPVPAPTIAVQPHDPDRLGPLLLPGALDPFAAIAFTSRSGISAFARALPTSSHHRPLSDSALPFTVAALGSDADLLDRAFLDRLCGGGDAGARVVTVLVPDVPTPAGLVEALGRGSGRRVLCPVPDVVGLREPPVVPDFLAGLEAAGWVPVRAPAYTTCWAGPGCAGPLVDPDAAAPDAVVFTSTAEVEGLLKGLDAAGWSWEGLRARWPGMVVAAHGPVTAGGARSLGVEVDVEETLVPAVKGTLNVLKSCKKNPFLKRVVLTSSSSAVDLKIVPSLLFSSKAMVWPGEASDVLGLFQGDTARFSCYGRMGYVHIDDVASSHILLYETPEATGRYLCSSVVLDNDELVSFLAKRYPIFPIPRRLDNPYGKQTYQLNTSKLEGLGFKFRGVQEMFDDCVQSLKDQGHLLECPL